jgi:hypothetical protein
MLMSNRSLSKEIGNSAAGEIETAFRADRVGMP